MKISEKEKDNIRVTFDKMESKEDFLYLLNYVKPFIFGDNSVPFKLNQITWYSNPEVSKKSYTEFKLRKKSGTDRSIHAPNRGLKALQKTLSFILQNIFEPHKSAKGFALGRSIVDNAKLHERGVYVYNIDLKDFFSSIDQARVWKCMHLNPFNLKGKRQQIANIIASICCTEMDVERKNVLGNWETLKRNVLPQGAPTSPIITNIVCQRLDFILGGVAKRFGLKYSRYADDITFSSSHNVYQNESDFLKELQRVITEQGFHIKESKTRLQKDGFRKEVTGLLVNEKVNIQQSFIKQLRMWLYYWERYGFERLEELFINKYIAEKVNKKSGRPNMINIILGKLQFVKMVRGEKDEMYLKLKLRFDILIDYVNTQGDQLRLRSANNKDEVSSEINFKSSYDRIRINIASMDSKKTTFKLQRSLIINKGELLPYDKIVDNFEKEEKEIDLSRHKPIDVTRFLLNFRASDGLKFLTHDYDKTDSLFDYSTVLKLAKKEFDDLSSKFIIPPSLWARINQFAFGDFNKVWRFNKVNYKLNWNSPELIYWIKLNPNIHPIKNTNFEQTLIAPFKKSIEIKSPELETIIKSKLAENLESKYLTFDIELIDLDKANFYTNVEALLVGMSYLFKAIKQRFEKSNKIRVEFLRKSDSEGRKRVIRIIHLNSISDKPLDKNELFQGDLLEAEKALFGICDWSIISKSTDDSVNKLNILFDINSNINTKEKIDEDLIEGFTHELTFYS